MRPIAAVLLVVGTWVPTPLQAQRNDADARSARTLAMLQQRHRELYGRLAQSLTRLAADCEERGLPEPARQIRSLLDPAAGQALRIRELPGEVQPALPTDLPADERFWRSQLRFQRQEYAQALHLLARQVLKAGFSSYAFELVREAAIHDPDNSAIRGLLGYVRYGDRWVTPFAAKMLQDRNVWHGRYGWLKITHVERYEKGERFFQGKWIDAAKEAEIRRDFDHAWEVRTDHYLVRTNHSLERGVEIATALEDFHRVFFETFAGFFNTPEQIAVLFNGSAGAARPSIPQKPHLVHYYRDRDEYIRRLKPKIDQIAITNGLYYTSDRTAYFFHDPEKESLDTLFHEATHQLFYESEAAERPIAANGDFWIIEGIACYMESFRREGEQLSLGQPDYIRFRAGRHRLLNDRFYVPLEQFASMGMQAFQTDANLAKNYSQAASLAHFFMHYDGGRYRDALIEHLSQLYDSRRTARGTRAQSLAELTGVGFTELDRQYAEFAAALERGDAEPSTAQGRP